MRSTLMTLSKPLSTVFFVTILTAVGCAKKLDNTAQRHPMVRPVPATTEPAATVVIDNSSVVDAFAVYAVL